MNDITIIGTGLAGYNLAKEIRKLDKSTGITLITADRGESYSKPVLSNTLSRGKSVDQLVLSTASEMAEQLSATIKTETVVNAIDIHQRVIETSKGNFSFDKLVLATGAHQRKPPVEGNAVDAILTVNNLDDYRQFQDHISSVRHVAIIGSGLIGCEFANDLLAIDREVTVIGSAQYPLDRLLLPEIGEQLRDVFERKGINWQLGARVSAVSKSDSTGSGYSIQMSNGSVVEADLVLSATGLFPNISLAEKAGLSINRGVVVDRYLETSEKDIYALGDCMEVEGMLLPYILPIMHCSRTLSRTLTGEKTRLRYPAMPVVVKTPDYPVVVSLPAENINGDWQLELDSQGAKALYVDTTGKLNGFILTGDKLSEKQALTKQLPAMLE